NLNVRKKRRRAKTTDSEHNLPLYPNLVKELIPIRPNQLWVSDITYMVIYLNAETGDYDFCYLSLVTDYYTKEIIGWCVGETLEAKFAIEALDMALKRLGSNPVHDLIHHSDRGVQYASYEYTGILKKNGIKISMTECGDPKDNAVAERVNGIIKNELLMGMAFFSIEEVRKALKVAIDFYNNERPHMSLDWKTPAEAALCIGELEKKWKSYREIAISTFPLHIRTMLGGGGNSQWDFCQDSLGGIPRRCRNSLMATFLQRMFRHIAFALLHKYFR
ncbi:MAG: IS3 family transposase, partial [Prevotella sp.]|nr:IS3 family transposase [Prevotella sp.]